MLVALLWRLSVLSSWLLARDDGRFASLLLPSRCCMVDAAHPKARIRLPAHLHSAGLKASNTELLLKDWARPQFPAGLWWKAIASSQSTSKFSCPQKSCSEWDYHFEVIVLVDARDRRACKWLLYM